jgi:hypothetical protein
MPPHVVTVTYTLTQTFTVPNDDYSIESVRSDRIYMKDGRTICADSTKISPPVSIRGQRSHIRFAG